ncbi:cell envelope integrity protein TolA [Rhizobium leguminosarum]|uniref:hypothetical protein n=1 Tax=Rhizobium leguminosarum TaxID=384 RepID=UPI001C96A04D|nr:hypothetical protein [Rhizobium leguminosarum]MBY5335255.1 cell envelope integrity protein TolA [Rhizobium leguminosarum]
MPRNPLHFAKSFGIYAALTGLIVGFTFPLNANAETVGRGNSGANASADSAGAAIASHLTIDTKLKDIVSAHMKIHLKLARDGQIVGEPDVEVSGGSESTRKSLANAGVRAVRLAAPFTMFPRDKYDAWTEVVLNFETSAFAQ